MRFFGLESRETAGSNHIGSSNTNGQSVYLRLDTFFFSRCVDNGFVEGEGLGKWVVARHSACDRKLVAVFRGYLRAANPELVLCSCPTFGYREPCAVVVGTFHYMHREAVGLACLEVVIVASCGSVGIACNPYFLVCLWCCDTEVVESCRNVHVVLAFHNHILRCCGRVGIGWNLVFKAVVEVGWWVGVVPYRS